MTIIYKRQCIGTVLKGTEVYPRIQYPFGRGDAHFAEPRVLTRNVYGRFIIDEYAAVHIFPTLIGRYTGFNCKPSDVLVGIEI